MLLASAAQMRQADQRTIDQIGIPGLVLMENAARGAVEALLAGLELEPAGLRVAVLCGRGNNGGDGLAMARILTNQGARATIYLLGDPQTLTGDAATNHQIALACGVPVAAVGDARAWARCQAELAQADVYVDAVLGTGLTKPVQGLYAQVVDFLNQAQAPVLAVDIPSGLSADTGRPLGRAVRATWTATFGLLKRGLVLDDHEHAGEIFLVDIGIPPLISEDLGVQCFLLEAEAAGALLPARPQWGHKGDFGHLLVAGGSPGMCGAACLAAMAGLRSGAGLVTLGVPGGLLPIAQAKLTAVMGQALTQNARGAMAGAGAQEVLELMVTRHALVLGPGLGRDTDSLEAARALADRVEKPLLIDADGLQALVEVWDELDFRGRPVVLTPHPGEAARLLGASVEEIQADRLAAALQLAGDSGAVVILKGARSVVAEPTGLAWVNPSGGPLLASGGTGDVLAGLIGGLMAQGADPVAAALAGVHAHGLAAELAQARFGNRGLAAEELADYLPAALATLAGEPLAHHPGQAC